MAFLQFRLERLLRATSLAVLFLSSSAWAASQEPLLINQTTIDPKDTRILYAAARPQGVLKSMDQGVTWRPARNGLMNTSAYHIAIHPENPKVLYLGTFGGGVYKSENGGERWFEVNQGLGNTNIHALVLNPRRPNQLLVSTSTGELFKSENGGKRWAPFNEGLPSFQGEVITTLLIFPKEPSGFYLAQGGLFSRPFSSSAWKAVESNIKGLVITALAYDPRSQTLYAGTMKEGLLKITLDSHPILAQSPLHWTPVGGPFHKRWIRFITIDPSTSSIMYVGIVGEGLYQSTDHGASWKEINGGLPTKEVESLTSDPRDAKLLYLGTHNDGLFLSRDGGKTWHRPVQLEVEPVELIIASLRSPATSTTPQEPRFRPPPSFAKCNQCHGWTDSLLNKKATFWRVPPNNRDWRPTVQRMSPGAGLTPREEEEIIQFLTDYSQQDVEMP